MCIEKIYWIVHEGTMMSTKNRWPEWVNNRFAKCEENKCLKSVRSFINFHYALLLHLYRVYHDNNNSMGSAYVVVIVR